MTENEKIDLNAIDDTESPILGPVPDATPDPAPKPVTKPKKAPKKEKKKKKEKVPVKETPAHVKACKISCGCTDFREEITPLVGKPDKVIRICNACQYHYNDREWNEL